ncbi:MAG: hypothetical protein B7Y41_16195 [Hydrogenophilales bacterium 28-61-23]|nr:MAG: hypothetical protein B7Y41_16195 [Hydrogenophilales bacterium 28-61-23]
MFDADRNLGEVCSNDEAKQNMYPTYYALRRVNPYRGVVHTVDIGEAIAHTFDGVTWHLRADDGYGLVRPVGVWEEGVGLKLGQSVGLEDLLAALETRPALPFPIFDTNELWLLDRESGLPLALLATQRGGIQAADQLESEWHPFALSYTGFHSSALAQRDAIACHPTDAHRDCLTRLVNQAARPHAMTQWFLRGQDGIGHGMNGLRLPHEWRARIVRAEDFPELLVRETWNSRLERSVISDYHRWMAPLLLLWPRLSQATRSRLELEACEKPQWLARVYRLLPTMLNPAQIQAGLVAARLEQAQAGSGQDDFTKLG